MQKEDCFHSVECGCYKTPNGGKCVVVGMAHSQTSFDLQERVRFVGVATRANGRSDQTEYRPQPLFVVSQAGIPAFISLDGKLGPDEVVTFREINSGVVSNKLQWESVANFQQGFMKLQD